MRAYLHDGQEPCQLHPKAGLPTFLQVHFFVHPARFSGAVSTARTDDKSLVHVGSRVWAGRSGPDAELRQKMVQLGTGV